MKGCRITTFQSRNARGYLKCSNWKYSTSTTALKAIANANDGKHDSSSSVTAELSQREDNDDLQIKSEKVNGEESQGTGPMKESKQPRFPISPLMDPAFHKARTKYSAPKPQPKLAERTAFQKQLAKNPYALALATPVRKCSATQIALPSFFLQEFTITAHPTTSAPWYVPQQLSPRTSDLESSEQDTSSPKLGAGTYTAMRQPLLQSFMKEGSGYTGIYRRFGLSNARSTSRRQVVLHAAWRADMDTFILEMMRRRIAEMLGYLGGMQDRYIRKCESWERVDFSQQVGCVLWMGQKRLGDETAGDGKQDQESDREQEIPPGEFEIKRIGSGGRRVVPVYNLRTMMGKEWVQKMKEGNAKFGNQILVVKSKNATKEVQMMLWKLQGYVATFGGIPSTDIPQVARPAKHVGFKSVFTDEERNRSNSRINFKACR